MASSIQVVTRDTQASKTIEYANADLSFATQTDSSALIYSQSMPIVLQDVEKISIVISSTQDVAILLKDFSASSVLGRFTSILPYVAQVQGKLILDLTKYGAVRLAQVVVAASYQIVNNDLIASVAPTTFTILVRTYQ